jgi:holo-[acyl-carrier protein] synthase
MQLGIDLVQISDFITRFKNGALGDIFSSEELKQNIQHESLSGVFAAKEAFFKALGKKVNWKDVWVEKLPSGKPQIFSVHLKTTQKAEVSISHSGDYATAIVIIF